jgi:TrmH family RNA methyltransferase
MDTPIITSAQNPIIKQLRKLATSSKARRDTSVYIAEGIHLTRSYLTAGLTPLRYICAESALQNKEVIQLRQSLDEKQVECVTISDDLFTSLATIHVNVGIIFLFTPQTPPPTPLPSSHSSILLEDIQDPGNIGTILRTATAAGIHSAFLSPGCTSPWSPKALRAGMGAQFGITIYESINLQGIIAAAPIPTLVTTLSPNSQSLYSLNLTQPVVWIFGNEGQGVSSALTQAASTHVSIPQADTPVESLNVAAAAAVCLYEQYRQITA